MNYVNELQLKTLIKQALREDIGRKDITTESVIPKNKFVKAVLITREDCVVCGLNIVAFVFKLKDRNIRFKPQVKDGQKVRRQKVLAQVQGKAQSILAAERVALNFLSLLSGIATNTRAYVDKVKAYKVNPVRNNKTQKSKISNGVKIMDTRKTIPGLRLLEKYAVRIGGGFNHRLSLDEMVLIKDNHLKVIGDYSKLRVKGYGLRVKGKKIELEVKNLKEFKQALNLKPDIIMLDNMSVKDMQKAVQIRNNLSLSPYHLPLNPQLEASGGITLKNIREIASAGVDMVSVGALTHSVNSVDISLEII
jgi:nicotinate-nucleotide pyrophosphorylase (carboxylating)